MSGEPQVSKGALDLRLGMQALDKDLITPDQLQEAMAELTRDAGDARHPARPLGAILVARGFLSDAALDELLQGYAARPSNATAIQKQDERLTELLIEAGVPLEHVEECLHVQAEALRSGGPALPRLGELMVDRGYATAEAISRILAVKKKAQLECAPCGKRYTLTNYYPLKEYACPNCNGPLVAAEVPPPAPGESPAVSRRMGKYQLVRELGRGGMGVVYEAIDTQLDRRVALKMMLISPNADPAEAKLDEERFLREARLSASLAHHPHIVGVYEAGAIGGKRYLAMEFIEGLPMSRWRKQGSVTIRQQVVLLRDVALAVDHAHKQGIIHRDLKPDNILLDSKSQPHVTDFGLAKTVGKNVSLSLTASGMIMGTPTHMSPEQAQGLKEIDHRTDVWSLGVMLYETLTGRLPFTGETAIEILMKAVKSPVPPPSTVVKAGVNPSLDKAIENICLKCLSKKPKDRYATAESLAGDLTKWLKGEQVVVRVAAPTRRKSYLPGRQSHGWVYACVGAAVLFGLGIVFFGAENPSPDRGLGKKEESRKGLAALLSEARRLAGEGKIDEAIARYEDVLRIDSGNADARAGKEQAQARQGELALARAEKLMKDKKYREAFLAYGVIHAKDAGNSKAAAGMAEAQIRMDQEIARMKGEAGKAATEEERKKAEEAIRAADAANRQAQVQAQMTASERVELVLAPPLRGPGIQVRDFSDGTYETLSYEGKPCAKFGAYLYFDVDDAWSDIGSEFFVELEYFDGPSGGIGLEYNASGNPYYGANGVSLRGTNEWKKAMYSLTNARLGNLQNGGSDFRLCNRPSTPDDFLYVHRVALRRRRTDQRSSETLKAVAVNRAAIQPGLIAEYYRGTEFKTLALRRIDAAVDLEGDGSAWPGGPLNHFCIRWTGYIQVPRSGPHTFETFSDDGVLLLIDGERVIDNWTFHGVQRDLGSRVLEQGFHKVMLEYFEGDGGATLKLKWREGEGPAKPIGAESLFHAAPDFKPFEVPAEPYPIGADAWKRALNLLRFIDPAKCSMAGSWKIKEGALISDSTPGAHIEIPYQPPEEYDFRIIFTRTGTDAVDQYLSKAGRSFYWSMGSGGNTRFGFGKINGQPAHENPTSVWRPRCLLDGKRYASVVQVRKDGVKAYLDGALVTQWKTDYKDVTPFMEIGSESTLGVRTWSSATVFHAIEVLEVTGKGRPILPTTPGPGGRGAILREVWTGIPGVRVSDLRENPAFPDKPSVSGLLGYFQAPSDWADNYGTRVRGFIHPPATGAYVFWIAGDDGSELSLSPDENPARKARIAWHEQAHARPGWTDVPSQKSAPISLVAGRKYYIEALQKEGGGGDRLSVRWQLPDGTFETPIPGERLSPAPVDKKAEAGRAAGTSSPTDPSRKGGLVGHWKFDEMSGTTLADSSGRGHTGAFVNQPKWEKGKIGAALRFDGRGAAVSIPSAPDLTITGDLTIAFWMKKAAEARDWVRIVGKGGDQPRTYGVWLQHGNEGRRLMFQQRGGPAGAEWFHINSQQNIEIDVWLHVACVVEGRRVGLYINGALDNTASRPFDAAGTSGDPLMFAHGLNDPFEGCLDEVRLYDRALSAEEVRALAVVTERLTEPDAAAQKSAESVVRSLYKADYAKRTLADVEALAQKLLTQSAEPTQDAALRFVLLREARDLAAAAGNGSAALTALDEMSKAFAVDYLDIAGRLLANVAKSVGGPEEFGLLADNYLAVVEKAIQADKYDVAWNMAQFAEKAAKGSQKPSLLLRAQNRRNEVEYVRKEYGSIRPALNTLQEKPEDPTANLRVGQFYCFVKRDWETGVPRLAKGADEALKAVAQEELKASDAAAQAAIGDSWWDLSQKQKEALRGLFRERGIHWYQRAWSKAEPALKPKLRERFKSALSKATPGGNPSKAPGGLPLSWGDNAGGGQPTGGSSRDDQYAHTGNSSVRVTRLTVSGGWSGINSRSIAVQPGDQFVLSGWVLTEGNAPNTDTLCVDFHRTDGSMVGREGPLIPADQPYWAYLTKKFTCPLGAISLEVKALMDSREGTIWLDDVSLKRVGEDKELLTNTSFEDR